jgi:hypothetical protein
LASIFPTLADTCPADCDTDTIGLPAEETSAKFKLLTTEDI